LSWLARNSRPNSSTCSTSKRRHMSSFTSRPARYPGGKWLALTTTPPLER
jgi:hypothetical protein